MPPRRHPRLSHDRRILLMALGVGAARRRHLPDLSLDRRLDAESPVDADGPHRHLLPRVRARASRTRGAPASDALESAGRARRRGLLHSRARGAGRRCARRGDDRGERARRDAAPPAARRPRGHDAAAQGDGGDRRRRVHVRRDRGAEVRQPRRRPAARTAGGTSARPARRRDRASTTT